MGAFSDFARRVFSPYASEASEEYLEVDNSTAVDKAKITVMPYDMKDYEDTRVILEALRTGYTIAVIDVRKLKDKDVVELKRAVSKIKKTSDALNGQIIGFGDLIIVTPSFAKITKPGAFMQAMASAPRQGMQLETFE